MRVFNFINCFLFKSTLFAGGADDGGATDGIVGIYYLPEVMFIRLPMANIDKEYAVTASTLKTWAG